MSELDDCVTGLIVCLGKALIIVRSGILQNQSQNDRCNWLERARIITVPVKVEKSV